MDKLSLKSLLMKNVKTDKIGRVLLAKDDEWRNETEWDGIYAKTVFLQT
jgi:hypothetical protein